MQKLCVKVSLALMLLAPVSACVGQGYGEGQEFDVAIEDTSTMDRDQDSVLDAHDQCPDDPEDLDAFQDEDGCPDPDNDGDRILDIDDKCPNDAEDLDDFQDEDGCPDPDNDQDGIPDLSDKCLYQPETYNGYQDEDGCPEDRPRMPLYTRVEITQRAYFNEGEDTFAPGTRAFLDELAIVLNKNPQFREIRVDGHTDARGSASYNQTVGLKHANIVRDYLIAQGVEGERLIAHSFGEEMPVCNIAAIEPGEHEALRDCRAQNRRVEFTILDQPDG